MSKKMWSVPIFNWWSQENRESHPNLVKSSQFIKRVQSSNKIYVHLCSFAATLRWGNVGLLLVGHQSSKFIWLFLNNSLCNLRSSC
jgi:hypothetical protein